MDLHTVTERSQKFVVTAWENHAIILQKKIKPPGLEHCSNYSL